MSFEFGIYTFGDVTPVPGIRKTDIAKRRLDEVTAAAVLADEAGLDFFGVGEHHTHSFSISAPSVVLGAIAGQTKRIKLTSATTVLNTVDPVRLFEEFSTLDLLSNGRAEIAAGRGALVFADTYDLFGYSLEEYDSLFDEKIRLLLQLNAEESITWNGRFRPSLHQADVAPRPIRPEGLPIWISVGRTPESAVRAGTLGTGISFGLLSGDPNRLKPLADLYREAGRAAGHDPSKLQIGVSSHGHIAKTEKQALDNYYPHHTHYFQHIQKRPVADRLPRADFDRMTAADQGLAVGTPSQIVEKILYQHELLGHNRYCLQLDIGGLPYPLVAQSIELLATEVAPAVRRALANRSTPAL
ncbi:LLM class flavin-dependent oxidoreductase [Paenibacillus filicis]|uniref:LLM class flavin-dependent oxidoreductase n=1 Tax=Paenibacillus filicis TaxID=669464 RepID=A0ABU9DF05_9BACL